MVSSSLSSKRYTYIHESGSETRRGAIDIHHVIINRSRSTGYARLMGLAFFLVILGVSMYSFIEKDNPVRTLSWSCLGKTVSRFIPIDKVLKPVLVECVTPVTCYWSLSLFLRGEEQLTLVFKELRPSLKMLVPIWKALCTLIGTDQSEIITEEKHVVSG
ncbi:hypothetical protein BRARA_A00284 [Brassica rapa]|uniref:Phosphatidylinositol N-acetylglucosaminyltransferase subunit H conserved domain-containing protein n=1 Tax=Brassica campestris TaxID=3711 RepID=A0A398AHT9_BRACM|nr:hypothetical protein BRARA_A00284 [Brassica rapa]